MAGIQRHPDRDHMFDAYEAMISASMTQAGYKTLLQRAHTRAAPFATDNDYLRGARDFAQGTPLDGDLRHMNAA
jgi:hypothetical protein